MHSERHLLEIYWLHKDYLIKYASGILGDRSGAEDVLQDAYLKFVRAAAVQDLKEPIAYLHRIVRNLSVDAKRRSNRERGRVSADADGTLETVAHDYPTPERQASSRQDLAILEASLAELPERTRRVLEMYWYEEFSLREIAAALGISVGLAHSLVADGLEHCRRRLRTSKS